MPERDPDPAGGAPDQPVIEREVEHLVYENAYVRVFDDDVRSAVGTQHRHVRIESAQAGRGVVLVPVAEGAVGLVRTFRYPIGRWQWALPRGFGSDPDPLVTAARELEEELGARGADLAVVGEVTPDSGVLGTTVVVVVAQLERRASSPVDTEEVGEVAWWHPDEVIDRLAGGGPIDAFTLAGLVLARRTGAFDR